MNINTGLGEMTEKPCIYAANGKVVEVNTAFSEFTGFCEEDVFLCSVSQVFNEILKINLKYIDFKNLQGDITCFIFTKSCDAREVTVTAVQDFDTGEVIYAVVEEPGSRIESKFPYIEQLYSYNASGIAIYHAPGFILLKANQAYMDTLEGPYSRIEDCLGKSIGEIAAGWAGSGMETRWKNIVCSGKPYFAKESKYECLSRGTTYQDITIIPIYEQGEVKYLIVTVNDVTQSAMNRKCIEEQARLIEEQKVQLEAIIQNMSDILIVVDLNGKFVRFNEGVWNYSSQGIQLMEAGSIFRKARYFNDKGMKIPFESLPIRRVLRGERIKQESIVTKLSFGTFHFNLSGTPVYDNNGNLLLGVICVWDVTDNVKYQEMLANQQKFLLEAEIKKKCELEKIIEMKDEFLSVISHEFKTPLTVINAAVQTLEAICKDELSKKAKSFISMIRQNSFRQLRLVNNLLEFTRINAGHVKIHKKNIDIVFLTKAITESVKIYAEQKGVDLTFSSTLSRRMIEIDEEKYETILLNLLSNSIKFTPKGKSISVYLSQKRKLSRNRICIRVKDEGIGIPKDKQELIFERFGQVDSSLARQAEGSGIGLSLVKLLIKVLEGEVSVESEVGKGSTFTVLLPLKSSTDHYEESDPQQISDHRLIQSAAIEFSDIYLS